MATVVKLSKPIEIDGKTVEELSFDFERLTGAHVVLAANESTVERAGQPAIVLRLDPVFQLHIAALACALDPSVLKRLGARDFLEVTQAAQGFLFASD